RASELSGSPAASRLCPPRSSHLVRQDERLPVLAAKKRVRRIVVLESLRRRVEEESATDARRDVSHVREAAREVAVEDVRVRLRPRANAVDEVLEVLGMPRGALAGRTGLVPPAEDAPALRADLHVA